MKLLVENFKNFLSENKNDPEMPEQISKMLDDNGYFADQYLGGGRCGSVYQVEVKKSGRRMAVKIVDDQRFMIVNGQKEKMCPVDKQVEVDNYKWVMDNRERLPSEVAKHLPEIYSADVVGDYGVVFMELLNPDTHKINMGLFLGGERPDPETGEDRKKHWSKINRAERLLDSDTVRKGIVKEMLKGSPTLDGIVPMIDSIAQKKDELIEKLADDASNRYANEYFNIQKDKRAKRNVPKKNLPDIHLEKLKNAEYLAQLFAQIIIDAWDESELVEKIMSESWAAPVVRNIRAALEKSFMKAYTKGIVTIGPEKERKRLQYRYQKKQALENFPEIKGFVNALTYLDEKEGFSAADVHSMNVMFSKSSREMVVVDLGLFKIGPKPAASQQPTPTASDLEPMEVVFERFNWFLEK